MRTFWSVFVANYRLFVRDRAALFFSFIFPIMFILIFGWAFNEPGVNTFKVALVDNGSPQSAGFIREGLRQVAVEGEQVFRVSDSQRDPALKSLGKGDLDAVIIVPEHMDSSVISQTRSDIEVYYDPSKTSNQQIMLPVLNEVINRVDRGIQEAPVIIGLEEKAVHSHDLRYIDFLVPGILGMSLMFTGVFGCLPVIQQRQAGIIKRLGCTPLRRSMLVFGEMSFRMIIVIATAALIIIVGMMMFDVQMVGNWGYLCGIVFLGTLLFSALGYLIAAFIRTEEGAVPVINIITFPMIFLSGTFFEVTNMPAFIQPLVKALPLTYLSDGLRQIMVDGSPLYAMSTNVFVMIGWIVVSLAITIRFFRWD
ncbi:MAG: ABC transporter permease [Dehalococcoidia bacterium]